jgi:hypothetical protein
MIVAIGGVGVTILRSADGQSPDLDYGWPLRHAPPRQGQPPNAILGPRLRLIEDRRIACLRGNIVKPVEHHLDPAKPIANIGGAAAWQYLGF